MLSRADGAGSKASESSILVTPHYVTALAISRQPTCKSLERRDVRERYTYANMDCILCAARNAMQTLLQDLRFATRQLIRNLGLTITAVVSLALGIGATTAVFSVMYATLMNP
jgi:hypothetical protein